MKHKYLVCSEGYRHCSVNSSGGRKRKSFQLLCLVLVCLGVQEWHSRSLGWLPPDVEDRKAVDQAATGITGGELWC